MDGGRTLYEVLGVEPFADADAVKRAWRQALLRVHPDHGGSVETTIQVQAAYEVLSDPHQRAWYDRSIKPSGTTGADADQVADAVRQVFEDFAADVATTVADAFRVYNATHTGSGEPAPTVEDWADGLFADIGIGLCTATTKKGYPCLGIRAPNSLFCPHHAAPRCGSFTRAGKPCHGAAGADGLCPHHRIYGSEPRRHGGSRPYDAPTSQTTTPSSQVASKVAGKPTFQMGTFPTVLGCGSLILLAFAGIMWIVVFLIDPDSLSYGWRLMTIITVVPLLVFALVIAGELRARKAAERSSV